MKLTYISYYTYITIEKNKGLRNNHVLIVLLETHKHIERNTCRSGLHDIIRLNRLIRSKRRRLARPGEKQRQQILLDRKR